MKLWNPAEGVIFRLNIQNLAAMQQKPIPGIDSIILANDVDKKQRYALVTNDAAYSSEEILSRAALMKNGFNLVKIFSPEHGISVKGADGVFQKNATDEITGLPVISLYGNRLMPLEEDLKDIDIVLFDIPDVGCRFYTYLWTMTYVMESCASNGKQLIILDRPNPIGGDISIAEGPMLDETTCSSFIGRWSMPIRHSCTFGELALYFSDKKTIGLDLKIIPVKNWQRNQTAGTPGFDFYPTSPAIRNISTALLYPGTGLLEGINVNEGRGTDNPFMQFGAPWISAYELQEQFIQKKLTGIKTQPRSYIPVDSLYKEEKCNGLELAVTDSKIFYPVLSGITLISLLFEMYPDKVKERLYHTNVNPSGKGHLDKLLGVKDSFALLQRGEIFLTDVSGTWPAEITAYLLYV